MVMITLAVFLTTWVMATLLIDRVNRAHRPSLVQRLHPYVDTGEAHWVHDVEEWLRRR